MRHSDLQAFEQFLEERRQIVLERTSDPILRHKAFESDKKVVDPIFTMMAADFTLELINAVNRFYIATADADAWYRVANPCRNLKGHHCFIGTASPILNWQ